MDIIITSILLYLHYKKIFFRKMMGNHVPSAVTENVVGFLLCYLPNAYVLRSSMSTFIQSDFLFFFKKITVDL